MLLQIDPRVDLVFKRLFANERETALAQAFWNALLPPDLDPIRGLAFHNPLTTPSAADEKLAAFDSRAQDGLNRELLLEMQRQVPSHFAARVVYYVCWAFQRQLQAGEDYRTLSPVYLACVLDQALFPGDTRYHRYLEICDRDTGARLSKRPLVFWTCLELSKFDKPLTDLETDLDRWAWFLKNAEGIDTEAVPEQLSAPPFRRAVEILMEIHQSRADYEAYWLLRHKGNEQAQLLADIGEEGIAKVAASVKVIKETWDRAIDYGEKEGQKRTLVAQARRLQEMLGESVAPESELAALSLDDLSRRVEDLLTRVAARL